MKLCHARDRTNTIHAVNEKSGLPITHCGWQVKHNLPYLSADNWGGEGMEWCPECGKVVKRKPRRQLVKLDVTPQLVAEIIEYRQDHDLKSTADRFNTHQQAITKICREAGFMQRRNTTEEERIAIFEYRLAGHSLKETSAKFGRNIPLVSTICSEMRAKMKAGVR